MGRRKRTVFTSGTSTPSLSLSTVKRKVSRPCLQVIQQFLAAVIVNAGDKGTGWYPPLCELLRHEDSMFDGDAEADPLDGTQVRFIAVKRRDDGIDALLGSGMIQHIDVFQGGGIILAVAPELVPIEAIGSATPK